MIYINAEKLVRTAAENGVLRYTCPRKWYIFVYHEAGDDEHPEGWYADDVDEVVQAVMEDEEAQKLLVEELKKKGIDVPWVDEKAWNYMCQKITEEAGAKYA